jgi:hypothetical protein
MEILENPTGVERNTLVNINVGSTAYCMRSSKQYNSGIQIFPFVQCCSVPVVKASMHKVLLGRILQ